MREDQAADANAFNRRRFIAGGAALAAASGVPIIAHSQFFDVPYVPTPQVVVDEMLRLAQVGPKDVVYDLGSGDGRIVITAARKFGARAVGVELDEHLIFQSEESVRQANLGTRVKFLQQDFFKTDFTEATVVTMYLLPAVMKRLREQMLKLKPGTRLVAHDFDFEEWKPDRKRTIRKNVFLWIVPAQVGGRWRVQADLPGQPLAFDLDLRQKYQMLDGVARIDGLPGGLWEPRLDGARIRFAVVDSRERENEATLYFDGSASAAGMQGELTRGVGSEEKRFKWRAEKVSRATKAPK